MLCRRESSPAWRGQLIRVIPSRTRERSVTSGTEGQEIGHEAMDQMPALEREERHRRLSPGAVTADVEAATPKLPQELTRRAAEGPHHGVRCEVCGSALRVADRRRKRHRTGIKGESVLERPYLHCSHCRRPCGCAQSHARDRGGSGARDAASSGSGEGGPLVDPAA